MDRDESWRETVRQLQKETKRLSTDISKMVHPNRIPEDCMARLDGRLSAPVPTEKNGRSAREMAQASGIGEAGEKGGEEKETAAAAAAAALLIKNLQAEVKQLKVKVANVATEASPSAPAASEFSSVNDEDGLATRFRTLQDQTGYTQIATLDADKVMSELFSHMVPRQNPQRKSAALLIGNRNGINDGTQLQPSFLDSIHDLKMCSTLNVLMTSNKPATCHVLIPMDIDPVSRTIFSHSSGTDAEGKQMWTPFPKSSAEGEKDVYPGVRRQHEESLARLFASLPEIEAQVDVLLKGLVEPPKGGASGERKGNGAAPKPVAAASEEEEEEEAEDDDNVTPSDKAGDGSFNESEDYVPEGGEEDDGKYSDDDDEDDKNGRRHQRHNLRRRRLQPVISSPPIIAPSLPSAPLPSRPFVHVMILNSGNLPMFLNMMCSASAHNLHDFRETLLVFAADEEVHTAVTKLGYASYIHEAFGIFPKEEHRAYGDRIFMDMMWLKSVAGWLVNRLGYDLLYLDSDLVMFKDTHALFEKEEDKGVDIFMQDDGARSDRYSPYFGNTGFFFVKANWKTSALLQAMLFSHEWALSWGSHQAVFSYLLEDHYLRNSLSIKILPFEALPTGKAYHHLKSLMAEMVAGKRKDTLYLYHMNWAVNNKDKVKYLRELGWWYIDNDRCSNSSLPSSIEKLSDCCIVPEAVIWPPEGKNTVG